ncbi:MAG: Gfo/Idh/MocA family oxidoreductase [Anaerolineae bacterium]|nr:Gfo/Idh/MocA family oxidoreductase [Anaerolineae bacterium]NUQ06353.1 Gfo/Idh/MocA family oxidoreductase [Anaerolineae bacterium]
MTTIGIGVIGMGWMGQVHSRGYNQIKDRFYDSGIRPRLVICADDVEHRAKSSQDRFGFEQSTAHWRAVIDHPEVQAVNITAPNGMHLEMVRAAAAAGKHVLCEKPVGRDPQQTIAAYEAARDAGVITGVGYNYRWAPLVQYARQLIESGELGTLTHYHGRFLNGYAGNPNGFLSWRFEAEHGLGTLGDLMSHVIDMAHMLAGPIGRLTASRETFIKQRPIPQPGVGTHYDVATGNERKGDVTNEDYVSVIARFASGVQGILEACRVINGAKCDMSFEVHGTKGALKWTMEEMNVLHYQRRNDANPAQDGYLRLLSGPAHPFHHRFNPAWGLNVGYDDLKVIEMYNFLDGIVTGQQGEPGLKAAYDVAQVESAIIRSWDSERWETVQY